MNHWIFYLTVSVFASFPFHQLKAQTDDNNLLLKAKQFFRPIGNENIKAQKIDMELAKLGKELYNLKAISKSGTVSCNSCHGLDNFGVDSMQFSKGHDGKLGGRNAPTTFNAVFNVKQFWDGRAETLADQAKGPVLNPIEHGLKDAQEVEKILKKEGFSEKFAKVFKGNEDQVSFDNFAKAVAEFEKTLITPSRFDKFLNGDANALSMQEKKGLEKFVDNGCIGCHNGAGIGGGSFQKLGVVKEYPTKDLGRFEITKSESDKFSFKVPGLRNIDKTGPYFHDGSVTSLEKAIQLMGEYQLGKQISDSDVKDIKAFLTSLTGDLAKF